MVHAPLSEPASHSQAPFVPSLLPDCANCSVGKGEAVCTSILQEKLKLLAETCTNKYLLLPAIFFFLWQVGACDLLLLHLLIAEQWQALLCRLASWKLTFLSAKPWR